MTAAIASIPALPKNTSWTDPVSNTTYNVTWSHAIVHLMPGVYAAGQPFDGANQYPGPEIYDWSNGLRHNREVFPIRVPRRVSIQGTSALNTWIELYDAGATTGSNRPGPAFEFGVTTTSADQQSVLCDGDGTFLDSITVHGAIRDPGGNYPAPKENAAIYIGPSVRSKPCISNCVFFANMVGISVAAAPEDTQGHDGTRIINNTFVANGVGVWNGQAGVGYTPSTPAYGISKLVVVNNVFQPYWNGMGYAPGVSGGCPFGNQNTPPLNQPLWQLWEPTSFPFARMGFQGIHYDDLNTLTTSNTYRDFNAYESTAGDPPTLPPGNVNLPTTFLPPAWGVTLVRSTTPPASALAPAVNLSRYTGYSLTAGAGVSPGILFVRDLFCNAVSYLTSGSGTTLPAGFLGPTGNPNFDGSPHDFRLAPVVTDSGTWNSPTPGIRVPDLQSPTSALNPLVDAGYWGTSITQRNGLTVEPPGQLLPSTDPDYPNFPYNTWIWDMEGHGNPRLHDHPLYPNTGFGGVSIDIGADEMGELIVAGYRFGTTSFLHATSNVVLPSNPNALSPLPMDNRYLWYIGPPTQNTSFVVQSQATPQLRMVDWPSRQGSCSTTPVTLGWLHYPLNYVTASPMPPSVPWFSPPSVTGIGMANCAPNGGLFFEPWRFTSRTTPVTCAGFYVPTFADVTPHLLPDVHPWWHVALGNSPVNPIWWSCSSLYNSLLYVNPWTNRVNPPGSAAMGGSVTVTGPPSSTLSHRWLDYGAYVGPAVTEANFQKISALLGVKPVTAVDGFSN
ncbi:MAG: hypothetical protein KDC87_13755 [Planctomycetes bacterium]|nr:hypothetical protein [Planctomycetota bacterium]